MTLFGTLSGELVDLARPDTWTPDIDDICQALGNLCRFGGHVTQFYSVAEHSVFVHDIVAAGGASRDVRLAALLHDAHEAYYGDIVSPLKEMVGDKYHAAVGRFDRDTLGLHGLPRLMFRRLAVESADRIARRWEGSQFTRHPDVWGARPPALHSAVRTPTGLPPFEAAALMRARYDALVS